MPPPVLPRDMRAYLPWLLPVAALLAALYLPLHWCWARWGEADSPQSYQPLVPLGAAWLAWGRRAEVAQAWREGETHGRRAGAGRVGLLAAGGALLLLAHATQLGMLGIAGAAVAIAGMVQCVYGTAVRRALAVPLGFLLLTAPLPNSVLGPTTTHLQRVCTQGAGHALSNLGVANRVEGNLIFLHNFQLEVVAPCSGVSIVCPVVVLTLGVLLARRVRALWIGVALGGAALVALGMNVLRITTVGLLGAANPSLARTLHDPVSWLFTGVAFGVVWAFVGGVKGPKAEEHGGAA